MAEAFAKTLLSSMPVPVLGTCAAPQKQTQMQLLFFVFSWSLLVLSDAALNSLRFVPHDGQTCGRHCQDGEVKRAIVSLAPGCCYFPFPSSRELHCNILSSDRL